MSQNVCLRNHYYASQDIWDHPISNALRSSNLRAGAGSATLDQPIEPGVPYICSIHVCERIRYWTALDGKWWVESGEWRRRGVANLVRFSAKMVCKIPRARMHMRARANRLPCILRWEFFVWVWATNRSYGLVDGPHHEIIWQDVTWYIVDKRQSGDSRLGRYKLQRPHRLQSFTNIIVHVVRE